MSGRHGLYAEPLAHHQDRAKNTAGEKTQLRGQQNAREHCALRGFRRIEAAEPPAHVPGREDFREHDGRAQHEVNGGKNHGERAVAFGLAALLAIAGEDGDKGDGGRAADEEIGDHVGQDESGIEGIGLSAAAEEPDNVLDPYQSDEARQKRGHHQDYGGGEDAVRVGG